ncbi:MAG: hypothetical protein NTY75_02970 [Candidatus Shapirobacteria bacterium]|nr:hypothetical protein [Candidatus Shapirobacteria bacterium]
MVKIEEFHQDVLGKLKKSDTPDDIALIDIVARAKVGDHWGDCEVGGITIGGADNLGDFSTLLFHEVGHHLLELGTTPEEEEKCYVFSRTVCQRLSLLYNTEIEEACRQFVKLVSGGQDPDDFVGKLSTFSPNFRMLLTFNDRFD